MAKVTVKLFGVFRMDTHISEATVNAGKLRDVFDELNKLVDEEIMRNGTQDNGSGLAFKDASVFLNGERCVKLRQTLNDGDEIWLLSPASGG